MVVPDALSRAVDMIDVKPTKTTDTWYKRMCKLAESGKSTRYKVENGFLYRKGKHDTSSGDRLWTVCVPKEQISDVLNEKHDNQSHIGFWKTLRTIQTTYFWPGIHQTIYERKYSYADRAIS